MRIFTSSRTRKIRTLILEAMLEVVIEDAKDESAIYQRGLCSIIVHCTDSQSFYDYFKKQRPTKFKHSKFYDKTRDDSPWWWSTDYPKDTTRQEFLRHLIYINRPFKLF